MHLHTVKFYFPGINLKPVYLLQTSLRPREETALQTSLRPREETALQNLTGSYI